ncbi:sulfatase-like hydrolase/transferase [Lentisphaera profundi]|uniref:Sulfatase-like hydrolase/transferase n=1 Tax=Lentisphaera profundi TaxID=1658616 RepID=A0ABY7VRR1_9BACT|nr:sulfatase-like hydrolase/transferase [Lentisphaera profundi]WDE96890.1 sulfatase-like hydrolase/transferase [Lentisphaera profundi]
MKKLLLLTSALLLSPVLHSVEKPNLIVIMTDDMGYADVGFNGCEDIPTPHIDSIASKGVKFSSGYTSYSVCGPSRAGFITGRYQQRFGFERNPLWSLTDPKSALPLSEMTIGQSLQKVGYKTAIIGKWHLGAEPSLRPNKRGFDEFFGHLGGGHKFMPEDLNIVKTEDVKNESDSYRSWITRNDTPVRTEKYLTEEFSDEAVSFVEGNKDKPFFLFLSYNAPHLPLQATQKYLDRFDHISDPKRKVYAAMVSAVDDGVGQIMAKLHKLKIEDNTIVFFLSDNGGPTTKNHSDNGPLKGSKSDIWEGGYRVPFAMQYTGVVKGGQVYDHPVSSLDIFATIADISQSPIHKDKPLDGVNLVPYVTGENTAAPHEQLYLRKFDQSRYAVRQGDYKLVIPWKGAPPQLYNLSKDIGETKNIAMNHPERVQEINMLRKAWDKELMDPIFLGLTSSPAWKAKVAREKAKKAAALKKQNK